MNIMLEIFGFFVAGVAMVAFLPSVILRFSNEDPAMLVFFIFLFILGGLLVFGLLRKNLKPFIFFFCGAFECLYLGMTLKVHKGRQLAPVSAQEIK